MNVVMTGAGRFVEVQGTAEGMPFTRGELDELVALAETGIGELFALQREIPAADRSRPRAAVRLEDVTVDCDLQLAHRWQLRDGPQRPSDETLDLLGTP